MGLSMKKATKLKVVWAVVLVLLVVGESYIGILPMLIWGLGFPFLVMALNWRALKYTKKRMGVGKESLKAYEDQYGQNSRE